MTTQRAKSASRVFPHRGDDFEIRVEDGEIFLTGYAWSAPEALTPGDAEFAASVITVAGDFARKAMAM